LAIITTVFSNRKTRSSTYIYFPHQGVFIAAKIYFREIYNYQRIVINDVDMHMPHDTLHYCWKFFCYINVLIYYDFFLCTTVSERFVCFVDLKIFSNWCLLCVKSCAYLINWKQEDGVIIKIKCVHLFLAINRIKKEYGRSIALRELRSRCTVI